MQKTIKLAKQLQSKLGKDMTSKTKTPLEVAEGFVAKAAATGTKLSKTQVAKKFEKVKGQYQELRQVLDELKGKREILDARINEVDGKYKAVRSEMMKLNEYMRSMTLSGSKAVITGESCDDVAYVRDGVEYHLEIDAIGDVTSMPMKEYKKMMKDLAKKGPKEEDEDSEEELTEEDVEGIIEDEEDEDKDEGEEEQSEEDEEDEDDADTSDDVALGDYYKTKK